MRGVVLILILAASCATRQAPRREFVSVQAQAVSVCEVMADPNSYVGRRIVIKGIYFAEPHQRLLFNDSCPTSALRVVHSLRSDGDPRAEAIVNKARKRHRTVNIPVVYSGIFTANVFIQGCIKPSCFRYSLEESQLLAASLTKPAE
jgi:hypothetical protein